MKNCKGHLMPTIATIACLLLACHSVQSQTEWKKYAGNPYFVRDITSPYEALAIGSPSIVKVHDTLKMYYAASVTDSRYAPGNPQNKGTIGRIMHAYSTDGGLNWNKRSTPVLDTAAAGNWDDYFLDTPEITWDGTTYRMYYFGDNDNLSNGASFGLATSTDGIHFTRYSGNPIISPGQNGVGGWDGLFIESPAVLYDNGTWYMAFTGIDTTWRAKLGVATSTDGIHFTKYANNPVVRYGDLYGWDGYMAATPSILKTANGFEMWYSGVSNVDLYYKTYKWSIGYAHSPDFFNWIKYGPDPVLGTYPPNPSPGQPDKEFGGPFASKVLYDSTAAKYTIYYENGYGFGQAYAPKDSALFDPLSGWTKSYSHTSGLAMDNTSTTYFNNDQSRIKRTAANTQSVVYNWPNIQSFSTRVYYYSTFTNNMKVYVSPNATTWTEIAFSQNNTDTSGGGYYGTTIYPTALIAPGNNYVKFEINNGYAAWSPQIGDVRLKAGNRAPSVTLTAPADSALFNVPTTIALNATASDSDGSIAKVEFYEGNNLLGTDSTAPYSYNWNYSTTPDSTLIYNVTAKATDNKGSVTWSPVVHVRVAPPATGFYDPLNDWTKSYSHTTNLGFDATNTSYFESDASRAKRTTNSIESIVYNHTNITGFNARVYYFSTFTSNMKAYTSPNGSTWTEIALTTSSTVATAAGWYATTIAPSTTVPSGTAYIKLEIRSGFDVWSPQIGGVNISFGTGGSSSSSSSNQSTAAALDAATAAQELQVFPNPANNSASVRFQAETGVGYMLGIYTTDGRLVRNIQQPKTAGGPRAIDINTADLPSGNYFLRLTGGGHIRTKQLTVVHR